MTVYQLIQGKYESCNHDTNCQMQCSIAYFESKLIATQIMSDAKIKISISGFEYSGRGFIGLSTNFDLASGFW